ncbi:MAG: biopolymer transporter ExbD [Flavobacteriaceae bacterium]|nr:biopolymer transporter ExbD [Flavobacteriaceae bacterium]MCF8425727.1 biopolymer transporter ExbD [Bacteroidia bacterium]MCF8446401.1 biopolymer transporter ExbD [Bacteroidia bacterium]
MNFRRKKRFEAEVATSSLNDIMFFLLLFFLIISTLANPSVIKVLLPKSKPTQGVVKDQVNLTINKEKEYYLNDKLVVPADLETAILKLVADKPDMSVVLRMDATLTIQDLVDVLAIGTKLKIRIVMATQAV